MRDQIARGGYERSNKGPLCVLFSDLRHAYSNTADGRRWGPEKLAQVAAIEKQWLADRCILEKECGALTIESQLRQLEAFIGDLPESVVRDQIPAKTALERETDQILAELNRRGLALAPA